MEIKILKTISELKNAFYVMKELRPHLDLNQYLSIYEKARAQDTYTIVGAFETKSVIGVMGYRVLHDYVHGKHLYIDDLVVSEEFRSKGIGKELLRFAEKISNETGCNLLRLSTGIENVKGKSFYEREGWTLRSVTYKKPVPNG